MKKGLFGMVILAMITGCGGGGGGGGDGGSNAIGFGVFHNFTTSGSNNHICLRPQAPANQAACLNVGGTWTPGGTADACSRGGTGSLNHDWTGAVCDRGTPATTCQVGSVTFTGSVSNSSIHACTDVGGKLNITCAIINNSDCTAVGGTWGPTAYPGSCSGYATNNHSNCTALGGRFYSTLQYVGGQFMAQTFVAGHNTVAVLMGPGDTVDVGALNPQVPVYMSVTANISPTTGGVNYWTASLNLITGSEFAAGTEPGTASFSMVSPIANSAGGNHSIVFWSPRLHFE
ncbi:MAG: hypothetical protein KF789_12535 [Bdellovibrionaceae bacterium]|nr:hypothetical protein [Pseudobdellovibrionaceae bacterium]